MLKECDIYKKIFAWIDYIECFGLTTMVPKNWLFHYKKNNLPITKIPAMSINPIRMRQFIAALS